MYLCDPDTLEIADVNKAAVKKYGYTKREFKKLHLRDIHIPEEDSALIQSISENRLYSDEASVWKHRDRSGRHFFAEIHAEAFEYEGRHLKLVQAREISQLTQQQELRRAAQHQTRYHLENSPLGIMEWDDRFILQKISGRITEISGYTFRDLAGISALDLAGELVHENELESIRMKIENLANGIETRNKYNLRFRNKQGEITWCRFYNSALRDHENRLVSVFSIVEDLTDQVKTRQALSKEEEKFRLLAENSSDVISRQKPDGTYIYVSPSIKKLTGFSPDELIGLKADELYHPDDIKPAEKDSQDILRPGSQNKRTYKLKTKRGDYIWVETISKALSNDTGSKISEIHSTTRDVTERKQLEEYLTAEKDLMLTAMESMPGIFYMINDQQEYVLWNKSFEELLGYHADEISGMHPLDFYRKEDHALISRKIEEAFITGSAEVEVDLIAKNGKAARHFITGHVFEKEGRKYVVGAGIDISDRIEHEKMLNEIINEKQVLLKEIHHRVKNNLAIINALLELQKHYTEIPETALLLSESQLRIKSMALIHEKLYQSDNMSNIDLDQIIVDLGKAAKSTLDIQNKVTIQSESCPLSINVNQAVPCALIINEALSNSIEHAFTGKEEGLIDLKVEQSGKDVTVSIQDDGTGIPEKYVNGDSDSFGFTIIHTLADQLEAELKVENQNGTRLSFTFRKEETSGAFSGLV